MDTHFVFVTFKMLGPAGSYKPVRYIDSQWASEPHAEARKNELSESLSMFAVPEWTVTIKSGTVSDAAIAGLPDPQSTI